jgi:hypothetical protein
MYKNFSLMVLLSLPLCAMYKNNNSEFDFNDPVPNSFDPDRIEYSRDKPSFHDLERRGASPAVMRRAVLDAWEKEKYGGRKALKDILPNESSYRKYLHITQPNLSFMETEDKVAALSYRNERKEARWKK